MARNYYVVLGVSRDADPHQIKKAYRTLVKRFHPDRGIHPADKFLELQEAFQTLYDTRSREAHDRELAQQQAAQPSSIVVTRPRYSPPRPGIGEGIPRLAEQIEGLFGEVDEFFAGWVPGIFTRSRGASRKKDLYLELELNPEEASSGGFFPLHVPVERGCPECDASGVQRGLVCGCCRGQRRVVEYPEIQISVPPNVSDGELQRLSLDSIGLPGTNLVVLVSVNP